MNLLLVTLTISAPSGWQATGELEVHDTRATIYAAINGAADLYFSYGLEEIQVREYTRADTEVEVEIYELGETLDAFGVLQRERPRDAPSAHVGAESAVNVQMCIARHGRFYLKAKAFRGKLTAASCKELLVPMTSGLASSADPPELALLPAADQVAGSLGYTRERYLGLSALVRCVHADYETGNGTYRAFVMIRGDWKSLAATWEAVADQPLPTLRREIPYTGWVMVAKTKNGIVGAVSDEVTSALAHLRAVVAVPAE